MIDLSDSSRLTRPERRSRRWGLWVAAGAAAVIGAVAPTAWRLSQEAELLPIKGIVVEGTHAQRAEELRVYAGVARGQPILQVDLDHVARRVEEHPFIKAASVRWLPPDALEIQVAERQPALAVVLGGVYLADEDGELFKRRSLKEGLDLPVVTGLDSAEERGQHQALLLSLRLLDAHKASGAPGGVVQQIHHDDGGLTLTLQRGLEVRLPREDLEGRMRKLAALLGRLEQAGQRASWIHLNDERRPERVAVRLRPMSEVASGG